jgi:hypothetical protein
MKPASDSTLLTTDNPFDVDIDEGQGPEPGYQRELSSSSVEGPLASGLSARIAGVALAAGVAAMIVLGAVRSIVRRRSRAARRRNPWRVERPKARSFAREIGSRVLLGAAGVLGARVASDVVAPAIVRELAQRMDLESDEPPRRERAPRRSPPKGSASRTR